jgi:steroid 5-alpha reductase family enzyme
MGKAGSVETHDVLALLAAAGLGFAIVTGNPRGWLTAKLIEHGLSEAQGAALAAGLCTSATLSYGMQFINFALSRLGIADNFTGLVEFLPAALIGLASAGTFHPRQVLLTAMLSSWSLRVGLFLLGRMKSRSGADGRMDNLRAMSGVVKVGLLSFWIIHGTWVRCAS